MKLENKENCVRTHRVGSFTAGFGAAFGPVMLFSLFWKRTNRFGALAGMISGGVMIFVWKYLMRPLGGIWNIYELLPAFIVSCVMIVAISFATLRTIAFKVYIHSNAKNFVRS